MGVPAAVTPVRRPTVMAFITAADGQGLADRTQRRFFSDGSLPEDAVVDRGTTTVEVMQDARASLPYALPAVPRLELKVMGKTGATRRTKDRRRLLAYVRVPGRVRFFLDEAVYADTARALLPEIAGYGAGLIDHLFRAEIRMDTTRRRRAGVGGRRAGRCPQGRDSRLRRGRLRAAPGADDGAAGIGGRAHHRPGGERRSWAPSCAARTTPASSSPSARSS